MTAHPRVLALVADERTPDESMPRATGCTLWRVWQPTAALERLGYPAAWVWKDDARAYDAVLSFGPDAVILPRLAWTDHAAGQRFIAALHRAGIAVIYEVDDDLFSRSVVTRIKETTDTGKSLERLEQDRLDRLAALRECDGVTVSSQRLATIMRQHTDKPVACVPNAIDTDWFRGEVRDALRRGRLVPPLTIGWAGGARPERDLATVAEAWGRIARRFPDVRFVVQGYIARELADAVPRDRLHTLPWLPLDWTPGPNGTVIPPYPHGLININIACCSVADTAFNRAKTPIKVWEATLARSVCVVSPTLYAPYVTHGTDGFIAETADEWEQALAALVQDKTLRRNLRRAQTRRVYAQHSLKVNLWRWPAAWAEIVAAFRARPRSRVLVAA